MGSVYRVFAVAVMVVLVLLSGCNVSKTDKFEGYEGSSIVEEDKLSQVLALSVGRNISYYEDEGEAEVEYNTEGLFVEVVESSLLIRADKGSVWGNINNLSRNIIENMYEYFDEPENVVVEWYEERFDVYGHSYEHDIKRVVFTEDNYRKVNWLNFRSENLEYVAEEYEIFD